MQSRHAASAATLPVKITPMTLGDLDTVVALEAESFPMPWTRGHFLAELDSDHSFPLVAADQGGEICGYICPMVVVDEGQILNVAVRRDLRGRGVGRSLVEIALVECIARGARFVSLEVRPSNFAAIALYRGLGFVEVGRRRRYYENGEDALLMEYITGTDGECDDAL